MPARSFPHYRGKWQHPSVVAAREFVRRYHPSIEAPPRCVLVWNHGLVDALARRFRARPLGGMRDTFVLPARPSALGISFPRGVGAPATINRCEELVALGTRELVGVGYAGALSPDLQPGDLVVCDGAIRDEGTSHHYAHPDVRAAPSPTLSRWLRRTLREAGLSFRVGENWTTDAPYRETRAELRHYRSRGVLTVDMEASAIYIFGRARRVRTASVFIISDLLTEKKWDPHFHRFGGRLEEVGSAVLRAWTKVP